MPTEELVLNGNKRIILVGTAHVSDESVKSVEEAIDKYSPDVVAVELCQQRFQALKEEKKWEETDILEVISSGRTHLFLLQLLLANFQRKIGEDVGVKPGAEMLKAIELAEQRKIKVLLADRDIKVTMKRAMDMMSFKEKAKLAYGFIGGFIEGEQIDKELIEKLKEKDMLTELMEELAVETPSVKKVLVDERDLFIANSLHVCDAGTIVAVVGAGHLEGIKRHLSELDGKVIITHSLSVEGGLVSKEKPKKRITPFTAVYYALMLSFLVLLVVGYQRMGTTMTLNILVKWFLLNGAIAAIGPAVALAHPLTILTAFIAAPLKILHPTIASGWFAGYAEMKLRKPRVIDFKNLMMLKKTSDYWNNRVVKVILVVAFTNITATIGNIVGLTYLAILIKGG